MSDNSVIYDPVSGQWSLSDGEHFLTVPHWARLSIADAYEREVSPLKAENAALRMLTARMARALGAYSEWSDPHYCVANCAHEFGCRDDGSETLCPIFEALRELEVDA